ncbi:hypothetical protein ACB094_03G203600 [Castanea mollissima]
MSPNRLPSSIFFLYIFLFCSSIVYCSTRDILKHGEWIIDNGSTLVSAGGIFELGFFTRTKSSSPKKFVGIWYHTWGQQVVVWVANRDKPILDGSTGVFGIAEDGKLKVWDNSSFGREYWSPGLEKSSSANQIVRLMDSGNLVLSEDVQSAMILWESFKYPTDTFLSGMKMDEKTNLVAWNGSSDPGPGQFTFMQDENESGEGTYAIKEKAGFYWKSPGKFMKSEKMPYYIANLLANFSTNTSSRYFRNTKTLLSQNYSNARLVMHYSGELRFLVWDIKNQNWSSPWWEPENSCSIYKACGKLGSCNNNNWLRCKCLPGSKPSDLENWNSRNFFDGCTKNSTSCDMSGTFLSLHRMKVRDPDTDSEVKDKEECKKLCVGDCRCQAYSYEVTESTQRGGTSNSSANKCWIWNEDLSDLQEEYEIGRNISVRVAKSDIGSSARNCEPCGTNVIPYPLSTSPNCGDPMYFSFLCDISTGQLSFKAPSGLYRVDSIHPMEQKFVIQVKNYTDNFKYRNSADLGLNHSLPFSVNYVNYWLPDPGNLSSEITGVEISWEPPLEPTCISTAECNDWPHSTCNATKDGKKRCHCAPNFRWDVSNLNCTQGITPPSIVRGKPGSLDEASKRKMALSLIVAVSLMSVIAFSCTIIFIYILRRKMAKRQENRNKDKRNRVLRTMDSERHVKDFIDSGEFREEGETDIDLPFYDLESILAATDSFSDANKLGQGGYGPVYKGTFPGGNEMAVKRLSSASGQGLKEFKNEVVLIAKLQHRNLVRLRGYCIKGDEKILLYEFMPNKSLDLFIFDPKRSMLLDWEMRFNIILGIARGLLYLHQDSRLRIIHRDMKTSNILLDHEMNPKTSDFGLARIVGGKEIEINTTKVIGTYGYMAPEYALDGVFSIKTDVFSFGIVLLEIISGKKNTGFYRSEQAMSLIGYAWRLWTENKVLDLIDQTLHESCNVENFMKCVNVGLLCIQEDPIDRPTMSNVVTMLDSETATVATPKQPAFVLRRGQSSTSSSSRPETYTELTISVEEAP